MFNTITSENTLAIATSFEPSAKQIIKTVKQYYELSDIDFYNGRKWYPDAEARQIAAYLLTQYEFKNHTYPRQLIEIGKILGKDRGTIASGIYKVEGLLQIDPRFKKTYNDIKDLLIENLTKNENN